MTTLTTDQGLILPASGDAANVPTSLTSYNTGVEGRLVKRYLSSADRTARNPTPATYELSILASTGALEIFDGSSWTHPFPSLPRGIMADPVSTSSAGTATSGTTETRDAVLGNYVFTSEGTTRRYRVMYNPGVTTDTANDLIRINVRDGGGSTPTAASTLLATAQIRLAASGGVGQTSLFVVGTFTASAGTRTLSAFTQRANGAGIETPVFQREIYVEDIGLS